MNIIAHRGNLNGPSNLENNPQHLVKVLQDTNFDIEVDIWHLNDAWFTGHDSPLYPLDFHSITRDPNRVWLHAKNLEAFTHLLKVSYLPQVFWHQNDDYALTKNGLLWTFFDKPLTPRSIMNVREPISKLPDCFGICTDFPVQVNNLKQNRL